MREKEEEEKTNKGAFSEYLSSIRCSFCLFPSACVSLTRHLT